MCQIVKITVFDVFISQRMISRKICIPLNFTWNQFLSISESKKKQKLNIKIYQNCQTDSFWRFQFTKKWFHVKLHSTQFYVKSISIHFRVLTTAEIENLDRSKLSKRQYDPKNWFHVKMLLCRKIKLFSCSRLHEICP